MTYYTIDTSTIISHKIIALPDNILFSSIVLMELMSSANDESERKRYEVLGCEYERDNSLIVPSYEDWMMSSKILYWLSQGRRQKAGGLAPKLKTGASQRMAMDVLLAVSARRWNATVVTENWNDFKAIQYYCKELRLAKSSSFLK